MKRFTVLVLLMCFAFGISVQGVQAAGKTIAVLPFYDDSGYRGPWQLYQDVPSMLGDMLYDDYYTVVDMDSVMNVMPREKEPGLFKKFINLFRNTHHKARVLSDLEAVGYASQLGADYAVTGIIEDFSYRRTGGGEMMIGGYKSYTAKVELSNVRIIRVADATAVGTVAGEAEKNDKGFALELLGKPRERDLEFYSLDSMDFGSKQFLSSLMGITTVEALNKVHQEIRAIITLPDTGFFAEKRFKVISVDNGIVNIDAGTADGVRPGDQFRVFTADSDVLVGRINITQLWADHISKAEIMEGRDTIRAGDVIMPDR